MSRPPSPDFATRLLGWFDRHRRDLPWRRTRDPWAIWVSEVMLQQTRVETVREPFARFLQRFPTPAAFASASDDELLSAWRGLGYYRRARLLREGARAVVREHGGEVPRSLEALGGLPGVGAYTKGAIGSIAFGHAEPAVDGNVERVLARHRGMDEDPKCAAAHRRIRAQVLEWLPGARAGDFNQALMELGATVCTPTSPACTRCPVAADCRARAEDRVDQLPVRRPPRTPVAVTARAVLVFGSRGTLGARIADGEPNAGQVELPGAGILVSVPEEDLAARLHERFGARVRVGEALATIRHAITHHRISLVAHAGEVVGRGQLAWYPLDEATPWTTPSRKVFRAALGDSGTMRA